MKKTLMVVLALVLVIAMSVAGTMAYLTDNDSVTNTFTVGKVDISLDEAKVNVYGEKLKADGSVAAEGDTLAARVQQNTYKLIPGHVYTKDPIVHFQPQSEASWLFVKVENGIAGAITEGTAIENQIVANGWTALENNEGVYYQQVSANESTTIATDYKVFDGFTIKGDVDVDTYNGKTIVVTAYAIQLDGFENDAVRAWDVVSK